MNIQQQNDRNNACIALHARIKKTTYYTVFRQSMGHAEFLM